jgi:hypothetical protein
MQHQKYICTSTEKFFQLLRNLCLGYQVFLCSNKGQKILILIFLKEFNRGCKRLKELREV